MDKQISLRITDDTAHIFTGLFGTHSTGVKYIVNAFPEIYKRTKSELTGKLSESELLLLLGIMKNRKRKASTAEYAGVDIEKQCTANLWEKIAPMPFFYRIFLEIWAAAYWVEPGIKDEFSMGEYVNGLT